MSLAELRLAWRMLLRDWRAGELRILMLALIIAVTATTAIGFFSDRLQRAMVEQSAELLGGDLLLQSPREILPEWQARAAELNLAEAQVLEFPSVVLHGEALQLAGVKAVDERYPLRGQLRVALSPYGEEIRETRIPSVEEAWVEARLLTLLEMELGDWLELGETRLQVTRVLTFEPSAGGGFFAMAPRVMVNQQVLAAANVLQPGSRISHNYLFAGEDRALQAFQDWLRPQLEPSHRLLDIREGQPTVGAALERAEQYLGLASLVAVLLAGVAIAMGARRYADRHFDTTAVMRCLGAGQRRILALYLPQLLWLGLIGSGIGVALAWLAQFVLFWLLGDLLPTNIPAAGWLPLWIGMASGLTVLAGFALPPVLRLRQVPALRVLRRELSPMPLRGWLVYGAALLALALLMWRYTGSALLTATVMGGAALALLILGTLAAGLLQLSRIMHRGVGVAWRYGLNNLWRRPLLSISQILAFGLTFMAMALIVLVRGDLIDSWQTQLPPETPNHFVVNILPEQRDAFAALLDARVIAHSELYPLVRGRLAEVAGEPLGNRIQPGDEGAGAVYREMNLTWTDTLPANNRITAGQWWPPGGPTDDVMVVSMEDRLAERLGVRLGDVLTFSFGAEQRQVRVTSLRSVQWDSFQPNFFMIFPEQALAGQPSTYMTSFHLPLERKIELSSMLRQFPSITIVDLDRLMEQVRSILGQVTLAVEFVLLFVLLAGFAVLYAALQASLDERLHEGALLRTLGASRRQLRSAHLAEFGLLGGLAGLMAAIGAELIAWLLYTRVFDLDYHWQWPMWLWLPGLGALLIGLVGYLATAQVVRHSPLAVLRRL